jgi:outer membrane protein OmpA-like peptidoglycan-associated protein
VLTENPSVKVNIVGHTDADGKDADNLILSKRRAESVKANLVKNFGIDASRLETDGKGASQPVDNNTTPEVRPITEEWNLSSFEFFISPLRVLPEVLFLHSRYFYRPG